MKTIRVASQDLGKQTLKGNERVAWTTERWVYFMLYILSSAMTMKPMNQFCRIDQRERQIQWIKLYFNNSD